MDVAAGGLAEVLELGVVACGGIREFQHFKEVQLAQGEVNVLAEAFDDGPTLGDAGAAFKKQVVFAGSAEQGFEDGSHPPVFFDGTLFYVLACGGCLDGSQAFGCG